MNVYKWKLTAAVQCVLNCVLLCNIYWITGDELHVIEKQLQAHTQALSGATTVPQSLCKHKINMFKQQSSRPPLANCGLCSPNNQLRSSSAHHHSVISIHNNTAASDMWQEAGSAKCKRLWWERGKAALWKQAPRNIGFSSPPRVLMSYYSHQNEQFCQRGRCCVAVTSSVRTARRGLNGREQPAFPLLALHLAGILYVKKTPEGAGEGSVTSSGWIKKGSGLEYTNAKPNIELSNYFFHLWSQSWSVTRSVTRFLLELLDLLLFCLTRWMTEMWSFSPDDSY